MSVSDDDEAAVFHDGSGHRYEKLLVSSLDQPKVKKRRVVVDGLPPLLESPPPSPSKRYGYDVLYQPENAPYQVNGRWFVDLRCSDDEIRTFRSQKASKKSKRPPIAPKVRFRVLERDDFTCRYCGAKAPDVWLHVDHVVSVMDGGSDHIDNLVTACQDCNLGKSSRSL